MKPRKKIALLAHESQKPALVEWTKRHRETPSQHELWGTGTMGSRVAEAASLDVELPKSGPHGGDLQLGAMNAEGRIDVLIFFTDPLTAMPHNVDVKVRLRISTLSQAAIASDTATADFILRSDLLDSAHQSEPIRNASPQEEQPMARAPASGF